MRSSIAEADRFNPCEGVEFAEPKPGAKTCKIKKKSEWPGTGSVDLIIKYSVITETGGSCNLDPYLVLRR
jgi:hypothetical protein